MLCEHCKKKDATVHLTEIIDGKVIELHLCEECAKKKSAEMEKQFGLAELLSGLIDSGLYPEHNKVPDLKCSFCGMRFEDFRARGRLGCANCYNDFKKLLLPLIKRVHGVTHHTGKAPLKMTKSAKKSTRLKDLQRRLQEAIALEEFEEAARLRDKINEINKPKSQKKQDKENADES